MGEVLVVDVVKIEELFVAVDAKAVEVRAFKDAGFMNVDDDVKVVVKVLFDFKL